MTEDRHNDAGQKPEPVTHEDPVTPAPLPAPAAPAAPAGKSTGPTGLAMRMMQIGAAGLVVGILIVLVSGSPESRTVSEIIDEIHTLALLRPHGGLIGKWFVSASAVDERSGRLMNFKIEGGPVAFSARTARVIVNAHENTFQFEMWDVVLMRVPDRPGDEIEDAVRQLNRYVLGPLPYPMDVVPDARSSGRLALELP